MPNSLLDNLRAHSEIVVETADLEVARKYAANHVNLAASRITAAAQHPEHANIVDDAIEWAQKKVGKGGNRKLVAISAVERLSVGFAAEMLGALDGQVSIEVDGRLAFKRRPTIDRARLIVSQLEELGVDTSRVLLKIPATWDGIGAATKLNKKSNIRCHMTLVFGIHQLAACADAGAEIVSPAVGRVTDWHKKNDGVDGYPPADDPGVNAAIAMDAYLARHGYDTKLMPGMFRTIEQATALAGCPQITLPPKQLTLLSDAEGEVAKRVGASKQPAVDKLEIDAASFSKLHAGDPLSSSKLQSAVQNLSWARVAQEKQLADLIIARQDEAAESSTARLFRIWDYDGDGFIDREEWSGSEEVFNALDRDNNGRISLEEMARGLGAPYKPEE